VALGIVGITKHQYYYRSKGGKQGVKPSEFTKKVSGDIVSNAEIISIIKDMHQNIDTQYGYIKMTYELKIREFIINKKKVYRLMSENHLLGKKYQYKEKTYAKYRKVLPERPLHVLEMDIKFVWVEQPKKHAYIITIIDTFTRHTLYYEVLFSITKKDVKRAWEHIIINHLQPNDCLNKPINIEVRNDNDKRFSAQMVRDFFKENHLNQVFTHPYTPQENGHIESFHAILSAHLKPYNFWSLEELMQNLVLFYEFYNNTRIHGSIAYTSPRTFWDLWNKNLVKKTVDEEKRKITFKLKVPHNEIHQHTGKIEPEGSFLHEDVSERNVQKKKMIGTEINDALSSHQLTV